MSSAQPPSSADGPLSRYRAIVDAGEIAPDPAQLLVAEKLQVLSNRLATYGRPKRLLRVPFFERRSSEPPLGLYIFGSVGRGKTMLMDMFFDTVRVAPKRRVHFHEFMGEVHDSLADVRKTASEDPVPIVAQRIAAKAALLCFDELFVSDIADAMILGRLFKGLFEADVVVVATSNAHPSNLYKDGLNRPLFEPFITLIEDRMEVIELSSAKDFRLDKLQGQALYFSPLNAASQAGMQAAFERLTGIKHGNPMQLPLKGRFLAVPQAAMGVARFSFSDLCQRPLGPNDFVAIARAFHTVMIEDIPILTPAKRDEARRLVTLIDTLYDGRVCLVASAQAEPQELYREGDGAFYFERTASRLIEMRSQAYIGDRLARINASIPGGERQGG